MKINGVADADLSKAKEMKKRGRMPKKKSETVLFYTILNDFFEKKNPQKLSIK